MCDVNCWSAVASQTVEVGVTCKCVVLFSVNCIFFVNCKSHNIRGLWMIVLVLPLSSLSFS